MKAMTISDISGSSAWSSDNWHYSSKRSTSSTMYHPMNHINNNRNDDLQYKSSSNRQVSRSLFGPSDPLESRRIAREVLSSQRFNDKNRWNFDFYHEKPIPGRFEWNKSNTIGKDLSGAKKYSSGDGKCHAHVDYPSHIPIFVPLLWRLAMWTCLF